MPNPLPECVDFLKQVERSARYEGVWPLKRLLRLTPSLLDDSGEISAQLSFSTRAGIPCLDGRVQADVQMECQRCLETVDTHLEGAFHFGLVSSEGDMALLPAEFEPLLVGEGEQSLIDVIEDELILSLPLVSKHAYDCSPSLKRQQGGERGSSETYKPFAGLKDMMRDEEAAD